MTGYSVLHFKFFRRIVDGKHSMRFQSETSVFIFFKFLRRSVESRIWSTFRCLLQLIFIYCCRSLYRSLYRELPRKTQPLHDTQRPHNNQITNQLNSNTKLIQLCSQQNNPSMLKVKTKFIAHPKNDIQTKFNSTEIQRELKI